MLWLQEGKQLWRTPLRTLAICLALALLTGAFAVAHALKLGADHIRAEVEEAYTTVGFVPSVPALDMSMPQLMASPKGDLASNNPLMCALSEGTLAPQTALSVDRHSHLAAYDITVRTAVCNDHAMDGQYSFSVFAVKCTDVRVASSYTMKTYVDGRQIDVERYKYIYHFDVVKPLLAHEDMTLPEHLILDTEALNLEERASAVEVGETYLVSGYSDYAGDGSGSLLLTFSRMKDLIKDTQWMEEGIVVRNGLLCFAKYSGEPEDYIREHLSTYWEDLKEVCARTYATLHVLSADHPSGLRAFIDGYSELLTGSFFTEEQLQSGKKIALISNVLAEKNGLSVGDTLDLTFYDNAFRDTQGESSNSRVYHHGYMFKPGDLWKESLESGDIAAENGVYRVVGIYSVPDWINLADYIHPDTVIVPQSALSTVYPLDVAQYDVTFILPNGGVDVFEAELAEAGFGGTLLYYDQGYASIIAGVEAICHSAEFVYNTVRLLWALSSVMVLLLFTWMQMPTGKVKYRLGTGKRRIFAQMSFSAVAVLILSGLGGFLGSVLLYDRAVEWMMQADFTSFNATFSTMSANAGVLNDLLDLLGQPVSVFARACGIQLVVLVLLAILFSAVAALRKKSFKV
ncbi:MAG: hypothetical protein IJW99_03780 [Clostridia bacterium]|nr:hypothetical protein [Clostridia bacterium]